MAKQTEFDLRTRLLGALPLVQHFIDRLQLDSLLQQYVPITDSRFRLAPAVSLGVALRNIIVGRRPLYGLQEWAASFDPVLLGLPDEGFELLNDDRVGRALDQLFDADRASFMTAVAMKAISEFDIDLNQFHNDSTSITFSGEYAMANGRKIRGKRAVEINRGHNKDHRPDLKQLLWILTVTGDGAIPIHYRVCDGNTNDDVTHIDTWEALRKIAGKDDFLYIADCKLCSRKNMAHIASNGGRFITVLPQTRREYKWFRNYIQDHVLAWLEVIRKPSARGRGTTEDIWRVAESPLPSIEGYRIIWVFSQQRAEGDQLFRLKALQKATHSIDALNTRLQGKRCRIRKRSTLEDEVQKVLKRTGVERWGEVEIVENTKVVFKQIGGGRPGPDTTYEKVEQLQFSLMWKPNADGIAFDARSDGLYPLITNCKEDELSAGEILKYYKFQPRLEKRHEQLKTVYLVAPALLKNEGRIEALLLLFFLAMLVQGLIERELRQGMKAEEIATLPLYPEGRSCKAPTANRVFEVFEKIQRHELVHDNLITQRFDPILTPLQRDLLRLMSVPKRVFPGQDDDA